MNDLDSRHGVTHLLNLIEKLGIKSSGRKYMSETYPATFYVFAFKLRMNLRREDETRQRRVP